MCFDKNINGNKDVKVFGVGLFITALKLESHFSYSRRPTFINFGFFCLIREGKVFFVQYVSANSRPFFILFDKFSRPYVYSLSTYIYSGVKSNSGVKSSLLNTTSFFCFFLNKINTYMTC